MNRRFTFEPAAVPIGVARSHSHRDSKGHHTGPAGFSDFGFSLTQRESCRRPAPGHLPGGPGQDVK